MPADESRVLGGAVGQQLLEDLADAPMEVAAAALEDRAVRDLLQERVPEREEPIGGAAVLVDQVAALQLREVPFQSTFASLTARSTR